jgi:hypothetical protein
MLETVECSLDVSRHGDIAGAVGVVPLEGETKVLFAFPVNCDRVEIAKSSKEMVSMLFAHGFDAEIIDDKRK